LRSLHAQSLPPALAIFEKPSPPKRQRCRVPTRRLASLADKLPLNQPDPRSAQGRWHPWPAVLNIICLAKLCGVAMGQRQIAEFGRALTQPQRRALGCRRDPDNPRHYDVPSESTFQRALVEIDPTSLEPLLLQWQDQHLGPDTDPLIAIDGKHVRRSGGLAIASAVGQPSQRVHATSTLQKHDSEITPVQLGLAGAAQPIVIIRTCTEKGKTTTARICLVTSRPSDQLNPLQILYRRRGQWGIEATCHQRLDVSLHEDQSRVRSPSGVAVLGLLSRISLALFHRDCQRPQPVRDKTYPVWSGRLIRRPRPMLDLFHKRCLPP
jgi:hypothetical protein